MHQVKRGAHLNLKGATAAMLTAPVWLASRFPLSLWLCLLPPGGVSFPFPARHWGGGGGGGGEWARTPRDAADGSALSALSTLRSRYFPKVQFWLVFLLVWWSSPRRLFWGRDPPRRSKVSLVRGTSLLGTWGLL